MSLAEELGMKTRRERDAENQHAADAIRSRIRASDHTITVLGQPVKCIDASGVDQSSYTWTGSGLVRWKNKIIERQ